MKLTAIMLTACFGCLPSAIAGNMQLDECIKIYKSERTCKSLGVADDLAQRHGQSEQKQAGKKTLNQRLDNCVESGYSAKECRNMFAMQKLAAESRRRAIELQRAEERYVREADEAYEKAKDNWDSGCGGVSSKQDVIRCFGEPDYYKYDDNGRAYLSYDRFGETKDIHLQFNRVRSMSHSGFRENREKYE